jgi:hypothetical protein
MRQAGGIATAALGVVLVLAAGAPAWGFCTNSSWCGRWESGQCVQWVYRNCDYGNGPSASAPSYSFGAIAYGRTSGAWGYSHRWGSRAKAESVAKENCAQHGDDCEVMVWFDRKCGAVVAGEDASAFWGLGNSEDQARADATNKCTNGGGKACEVEVSHCSM